MYPNTNLFASLDPMESIELLSHQLPPGFRFHPTDEELINDYLKKKITSTLTQFASIIADINIYKYNPWDLPAKAFFGDQEWFFFSPRDRKYPNGARPNRSAASGYWKATGTDKPILDSNGSYCIGVKKALVFYKGRPPKGIKTEWMMHEYRLIDPTFNQLKNKDSMRLDDWVLCRIRQKSYSCSVNDEQGDQKMSMQEGSYYELFACYDNNNNNNNNIINEQEDGDNLLGETQTFQEVIDTIKRKVSFGAVDELLMLPQSNKRVNYGGSQIEEFSPFGFDFVDQEFVGLLM